ncbi:SPOR domain-containing protein [Marinomonas sp. 5E14-1]|uniref:SPOR domain-containing protein n=1 Tax=Marinomonas sp. 5E14-1 TaxID=3153922 RepID=UPI003267A9F8
MIDRTITYRLIGASIMVLSAAIILPLILDGERPPELDVQVQVSEPPELPTLKIAPVQPVDTLPIESSEDQKEPQEISLIPVPKAAQDVDEPIKQAAPKTSKKVVVEKPAPKVVADRWVVQIASFKSKDNATRLVEKLKLANYDAYSTTTNNLYKVFVGPEFKRETSEKIRNEIKSKFSLSGIVVKFSTN